MNKTTLEWMPLHSGATCTENPGKRNSKPFRKTGMPESRKSASATYAEPYWRKATRPCSITAGNGIMKTKKPSGKTSGFMNCRGMRYRQPEMNKQRKANVVTASESEVGRCRPE